MSSPRAEPRWQPKPGEPHDTCFRCGRPTPLGVSLCEVDNPGHVKSPSSTQAHGTIALGVVGGFIGFLLLAGAVASGAGPFSGSVRGQATQPDGGVEVVLSVTNQGSRQGSASCRVSRGGSFGANDLVFVTGVIPAGETRDFSRTMPASGPGSARDRLTVRCN